MSKLGFLKNVVVAAQEQPKPGRNGGGGVKKEWNPASGLVIRLWKDGSVFPSQELVDFFQLEYSNALTEEQLAEIKEGLAEKPFRGNGFDVIDSRDFPAFNLGDQRVLIIAPAEKDLPKVDLFSSVGYNEDGTPKVTVMDQGAVTFGKDFLIPRIEEIYGIVFAKAAIPAVEAREAIPEETDAEGKVIKSAKPAREARPEVPAVEGVEYVDLVFVGQEGEVVATPTPWVTPKPIAFFPKTFARGEKKGESTVERRENPQMYVLYPKQLLEEDSTTNTQESPNEKGE
jgi:hypothetical protein